MTDNREKLRTTFLTAVGDLAVEDSASCGPPVASFRACGLRGMRFELRPASVAPPPAAAVSLIYRRDEEGRYNQAGVAFYKNGTWKRQGGKPMDGDLFWTMMVSEDGEA